MRHRKPRINLFGYANSYGTVVRTERANYWFIKCFSCGKEHEQDSSNIQENRAPRSCANFKPHNSTGISKDDQLMRRMYNITLEQYNELLAYQGGGCAICRRNEEPDGRRLSIDHCHDTGVVRGVLCNQCNNGIGALGDNYDLVIKAAAYLKNPPMKELRGND